MTDPRIAVLAKALHWADKGRKPMFCWERDCKPNPACRPNAVRHQQQAAAILAALPPDWCGHGPINDEMERELNRLYPEIARLRRIEEAAWAHLDQHGPDECYEARALRAALEDPR